MARTDVASLIAGILEAYVGGSQLFKISSHRQRKRRSSRTSPKLGTGKVLDSLAERRKEIKAAYDQAVLKHGQRFEDGDGPSQTKLAQILLRLNTGLTRLLNHALPTDDLSQSHSRVGIFHLSEAAAIDTLSTLSDLSTRLSLPAVNTPPACQEKPTNIQQVKTKISSHPCPAKPSSRRPASDSLLQNGAWVRRKSAPNAVSVVVGTRSRSNSKVSVQPRAPIVKHATDSPKDSCSPPASPPPKYSELVKEPLAKKKVKTSKSPERHKQQCKVASEEVLARQPSMYVVSADFFDAFPQAFRVCEPNSLPRMQEVSTLDADRTGPANMSPEHPVKSRSRDECQARARPMSIMTFMTASTKLGEIPEHRLPDRALSGGRHADIPMPYVLPEMLEPPKRKAGRGLKFWKKEPRNYQSAAA